MLIQHSAGHQLLTLAPPTDVCVCCTHMYICICLFGCVLMCGSQKLTSGVFLHHLYIEAGSHLNPKFTDQLINPL